MPRGPRAGGAPVAWKRIRRTAGLPPTRCAGRWRAAPSVLPSNGQGRRLGRPAAGPVPARRTASAAPAVRARRPSEQRSLARPTALPAGAVPASRSAGPGAGGPAGAPTWPLPDTGSPGSSRRSGDSLRAGRPFHSAVRPLCLYRHRSPLVFLPAFGMGIGLLRKYARLWQSGTAGATCSSGRPRRTQSRRRRVESRGARLRFHRRLRGVSGPISRRSSRCRTTAGDLKLMESCRPRSEKCSRRSSRPPTRCTGARWTSPEPSMRWTAISNRGTRPIDERIAGLDQGARRSGTGPTAQAVPAAAANYPRPPGPPDPGGEPPRVVRPGDAKRALDLLRLRSAGVAAVLDDLTQATHQAKALSRNVDNAIAAAGEIREAMRPIKLRTTLPRSSPASSVSVCGRMTSSSSGA